ncbi:unnamed protein product [Bursaphelenchus xylophilus]|uniref:(pine wood nematode) hypothetical protein n=1 Tax=Bursaphelenchus xylophilus TaxID=6326 RepID=A0A1I7SEQ6_BURXY|nr:unnamed protein product [Bursaphelenchus xylophilus]CAG9128255.1 unnamed protein product [Bursaphelenchus xylophilus]
MPAKKKSPPKKETTLPDEINDPFNEASIAAAVQHGEWTVGEVLKQLCINSARFVLSPKIVVLLTVFHLLAIYTIYYKDELSAHRFGKIYLAQVDLFLETVKGSVWPGSDQYLFSKTLGPYITKYEADFRKAMKALEGFSLEKGTAFFVANAHDLGLGVAHMMAVLTYTFAFVLGKYPIALFFAYALNKWDVVTICNTQACLLVYFLFAIAFPLGVTEVIFLLYAVIGLPASDMIVPTFFVQLASRMFQAYLAFIIFNFQSDLKLFIAEWCQYEYAKPLKPWLLDFVRYMESVFEDPGYWKYSKPKELPVGVIFSSAVVALSIVLLTPKIFKNLARERKMTKYYEKIQRKIEGDDITHDEDESSA